MTATAFDDTLRVWDVESGEARVTVQLPGQALALDFSADGTAVAVLCKDKNLHIYDARRCVRTPHRTMWTAGQAYSLTRVTQW